MVDQLLTNVKSRSVHELYLLVEFVVSKTIPSHEAETRKIGRRALKWSELLKNKKNQSSDGAESVAQLTERQILLLGKFLQPLGGLFEDKLERRALIDRMRQAKFRSQKKEKPISVHVSGTTAQRLQNLRTKKGFRTPQEAIKFLLDSHYGKLKNNK